jgi:SAM-dependent methyltransferase
MAPFVYISGIILLHKKLKGSDVLFDKMYQYMSRPKLYTKSSFVFWDDEHVSKKLLEAHLNPDLEAASRSFSFMDRSTEWICEIAPAAEYEKLLDLGCGPGLYAERLTEKGFKVTGMDYSRRSINYAVKEAEKKNQDIEYIYKDYMNIDYEDQYDLVTLIFTDYGVLSEDDREVLLRKIHKALKPGGKVIMDVSSHREYDGKDERSSWYISEGGFWKPDKHICLESHLIYDGNIRLDQYVIIDMDDKVETVRNWFKPFTREEIVKEANMAGFEKVKVYSDVTGKTYSDESKTICLVMEKQ